MADHELALTQRNAVLQAIRDSGLDPNDFSWHEQPSQTTLARPGGPPFTVQALVHVPTDSAFLFDLDAGRGDHVAIYKPGREGPTARVPVGEWRWQYGQVLEWLSFVQREHDAPDLWFELDQQADLLAPPQPEAENSPFTPPEREAIARELREMKELIAHGYSLQEEQLHELEARVDYLTAATERLNRFDWKQVLGRELIGLVLRAVIPVEAFHEAVHFLGRAIGYLFPGDGGPELPGGPPMDA